MKKLSCLVACLFVLAVSGCAKEEKVLTCTLNSDTEEAFTEESKYEMKAKGDEAYLQVSETKLTFKDKEDYDMFSGLLSEEEEEGYSFKIAKDDAALSMTMTETMDLDVLSIERIKEITQDDEDFDYISLDMTRDNLKAEGYTCTE